MKRPVKRYNVNTAPAYAEPCSFTMMICTMGGDPRVRRCNVCLTSADYGESEAFQGGNSSKVLTYNGFGALVSDDGCGMASVFCDSFGNTVNIEYTGNRSTTNVYSATGEKLKRVHMFNIAMQTGMSLLADVGEISLLADDMNIVGAKDRSTVEYHGPVVYRNGNVDMVLFPGGYATVSGTTVTFHYYTQDYLGNNRAVVNGTTGLLEQAVAYYPYGGVIADLGTNATTGQPYKFGGKELITASGLNEYDFGARQYYSAVPGFTKPDPMCEKYYWLSPYLYCGNNPVNAIDPYGCDIWSLDGSGRVISSQTFENFDMLLVYDQNGKLQNNWIGKYGSIQNQFLRKSDSGREYTVFEAINDDIGTSIFEFLADNISVEWSQIKSGMNEEAANYISTSHLPAQEYSAEYFIKESLEGVNIRSDTHSHPNGSDFPSGMDTGPNWKGDIRYARWLEKFAPSVPEFFIYLPSTHEYINYNSHSIKYDFPRFFNSLPPINVGPLKSI